MVIKCVCVLICFSLFCLSLLIAPRKQLSLLFLEALNRIFYFLPLDHIPANSGSQIASAAQSYCKQFIRNFSSDNF